jgi:hypothetical protein
MVRQERVWFGEKLYVTGFVAALVAEALLALVALGTPFPWVGFVTGVIFFVVVLLLANWLYTGNPTARTAAVVWSVAQLAVAAGLLALFLAATDKNVTSSSMRTPTAVLAAFKLVVYAGLLALLLFPRSVRDFLATKRGEEPAEEVRAPVVAEPKKPAVMPTGVPLKLADDQTTAVRGLATLIGVSGAVLVVVGILRVAAAYVANRAQPASLPVILAGVEGAVTVALGLLMALPALAFRLLAEEGNDLAHLLHAFNSLTSLYRKQLILGLILAAALVVGIVVQVMH